MRQLEFIFSRKEPRGQSLQSDETGDVGDAGGLEELEEIESKGELVTETIDPPRRGHDRELTAQCVESLQLLGLEALASVVVVEWNSRMRTTAGRAFWPCGRIELNPKLEALAPQEVRRTLLHELAHLVAYARAGRKRIAAHGVEWRQACAELGIPGERATHSLPLPGRTMQRKWRYECPACGEGVDRVRQMKRRAACYTCCKNQNGGYYHRKFRLVEKRLS